MPVLSARHLSKSYGVLRLFEDASLTIDAEERVGLLGRNGAGKSTLLRVLGGIDPTDSGTLDRQRGAKVAFVAQEPELDATLTARQIVQTGLVELDSALARHAAITHALEQGDASHELLVEQAKLAETVERLGGWSPSHKVETMLDHLGVAFRDRPVGTLSGGERRRVALARALVAQPELLILDEPTNHLDVDTIAWLETHLADEVRSAVLLVTHDRYVLDAVCDRIVELDGATLREYQGGYADYLEQKAERLAHESRVEQNRLNILRRERAWMLRGAKARTTKQKARLDRANALLSADPLKELARVSLSGLEAGAPKTGKTVLDFEGVGLELGGRTLVRELTLRLVPGDRVGLVGPNGIGKTSLLRVAAGELPATRGKVVIGTQTTFAYFDQARANLEDDWSIFDNVAEREGAERTGAGPVTIGERTMELRTYLELFLFSGIKLRQKVGALSGGERARVALAKALRTGANLLLLDEPTNDLDVDTLSSLEELLADWPGCILVVSHDRFFFRRVVTSILAFEGDGRVIRYAGDYDDYRMQRARAEAEVVEARAATRKSAAPPPREATTGPKALTYAERIELDGLLERITLAEEHLATLQARLAEPSLYSAPNVDEARRTHAEHAAAQTEVAQLMARWEELEGRRGAEAKR